MRQQPLEPVLPNHRNRSHPANPCKRLAVLLGAVVALAGCNNVPATASDWAKVFVPTQPHQLRVMTFNVAMMSFEINYLGPLAPEFAPTFIWDVRGNSYGDLDYDDRAALIGQQIKKAGADVVVLNEVYSDGPRDELIAALKGTYPHFVSELRTHPFVEPEVAVFLEIIQAFTPFSDINNVLVSPNGSGLMLFSKFPLLEIDDSENEASCVSSSCGFDGQNNGGSLKSEFVGFRAFRKCSGFDCFASKGFGLVKLETPGAPTHVGFTHMQADTGNEGIRREQLAHIDESLRDWVSSSDLVGFPVYVAGDMNVYGGTQEWTEAFDPSLSKVPAFACGNDGICSPEDTGQLLTEGWGFGTSPDDVGSTNISGSRLDYVNHNSADGMLCLQHIKVAYENAVGDEEFFSDHRPLVGDFNQGATWCSPNLENPDTQRRPNVLNFPPLDCGDSANPCDPDKTIGWADGAKITHAGSYQWFVIDQPGSYGLRVSDNNPVFDFDFDVYGSTDLSRPLASFNDIEGEHGWEFPMHEPPYYIRVFATDLEGKHDRTTGGLGYTLDVHQFLCREPGDACAIDPTVDVPYPWPDNAMQTAGDVDQIWFKFHTSTARDGRLMPPGGEQVFYPKTRMFFETVTGPQGCFEQPLVVDYGNGTNTSPTALFGFDTAVYDDDKDFDDDGSLDHVHYSERLPGKEKDKFAEYYVTVPRSCDDGMQTNIRFETSLTYFKPGQILCEEQFDDSGIGHDDLVRFEFTFDKLGGGQSAPCENNCDWERSFDEAWPEPLQEAGQAQLAGIATLEGYYVNEFYPNLFEDEGDASDPDQRLRIDEIDAWAKDMWSSAGLATLDLQVKAHTGGKFTYRDKEHDDYEYWMKYTLNHRGPIYKQK